MGSTTFVRPSTAENVVQPVRTTTRPLRLRLDVWLLLSVVSLIVIGLLMVYSASWNYALRNGMQSYSIVLSQAKWVGVGLIAAIVLSYFNYHRLKIFLLPMMAFTFLAMFIVLWVSDNRYGATRTLMNGSIEPSELAKLAIIIYLSFWLFSKKDKLNNLFYGLIPLAFILGGTAGMILLQPDLSAAATVVMLGGLLFFLAGGEVKQIILTVAIALLLGYIIATISSTGHNRLTQYINGLQDPQNASYQVQRSLEAVVKGGVFGVGLGNSTTKYTGLPVPWTDSIFAIITEETGLVGAFVVLMLYIVLLWRGLSIARRAPDLLGKLLASGITFWITIEAVINMGAMVNLVPFAGNALPLISAGGSNLTMTLAAIGVLMNVARQANEEQSTTEGRPFSAVVDLRRRDRRRRVPRNGHITGSGE
ncbi:MAG TPA: FtsW/RodA/SpoVE family cell cycle protein [Anaerolineaceae bacterium]|nr:FtsW/RodA/SpoVE family cell cycle protein [Anaerolineaceae bacterium]